MTQLHGNTDMQAPPAPVAVIILDSGFSPQVLGRVRNLLAYQDLNSGLSIVGQPIIGQDSQARQFIQSITQDPLNHGSVILERLLDCDPDLPLILVRGFGPQGGLIRSRFEQGKLVADGWTEAYLWAQNICAQKGYCSVANFSFGGFHHTMDGKGWENFQLSKVVGAGKPGHLLAGAAGPGHGRAVHASLSLAPAESREVHAVQSGNATYNLLVDRLVPVDASETKSNLRDFILEVCLDGRQLFTCRGLDLVPNLWNGKQQLTFEVSAGQRSEVTFKLSLLEQVEHVEHVDGVAKFDLFISREEGAYFKNCVDSELVCEPALFDTVIAVGLKGASYGTCRVSGWQKPEILLEGSGPISFRTPEVTFALVKMLRLNPELDVPTAREGLMARV